MSISKGRRSSLRSRTTWLPSWRPRRSCRPRTGSTSPRCAAGWEPARAPPSPRRPADRPAARTTSPGRWPWAGCSRWPVNAPRGREGRRTRSPRPSTRAPMSRRGTATRSIGRVASEASPLEHDTDVPPGHQPGQEPDGGARVAHIEGGAAGSVIRCRPPVIRFPSMVAPSAVTAAAVRATSSPSDSPRTSDVPSATAARSRARWDRDLSPGTAIVPVRGRPPVIDRRRVIRGSGPWTGRPGRPGQLQTLGNRRRRPPGRGPRVRPRRCGRSPGRRC